jgi:hypothetical protein
LRRSSSPGISRQECRLARCATLSMRAERHQFRHLSAPLLAPQTCDGFFVSPVFFGRQFLRRPQCRHRESKTAIVEPFVKEHEKFMKEGIVLAFRASWGSTIIILFLQS